MEPAEDAAPRAAVRGHRRGPAWRRVTYGAHVSSSGSPRDDLQAWQLLMTSQGSFTGLTALQIRGVPLPPLPVDLPVFVALGKNDPRPMRTGIVTSRHITPVSCGEVDGLRVATTDEALCAASRWLGDLDAVAVLDAALNLGVVDGDGLDGVLVRRRPGAQALRRAMAHADGRAESIWETLLRRLHEVCDVEVEPQWELRDPSGDLVARADLWVRGTTSLHEYDGDCHDTPGQRTRDRRRDRRIDAHGHVRRGYTSGDLLHRAVSVLEDADRALGRAHEPERIRSWHELLRDSLFTAEGRARFLARLPRAAARRRGRP